MHRPFIKDALSGLNKVFITSLVYHRRPAAFAELVKAGEGRVRLDKVPIAVTVKLEGLLPRHGLGAASGRDVLNGCESYV